MLRAAIGRWARYMGVAAIGAAGRTEAPSRYQPQGWVATHHFVSCTASGR
jgi:hypothetical protein